MSTPPSNPISLILALWSIPNLLPPSLPLPPNPSPSFLTALLSLANLTPTQPERAWNLISTYFHARIREASYTGRSKSGVYAFVEEEDVIKACGSVRRMSMGREMEVGVKREESNPNPITDTEGTGKRKWSIRDEIAAKPQTPEVAKTQPTQPPHPQLPSSHEQVSTTELPPLPALLDMPPRPESRIELPPIYTLTGRSEHRVPLETLIEAARGAMYEKNLRRRELEDAEVMARIARGRFLEAKMLAERLRGEVKREGERGGGLR